jgi:hypothetical protein
VKVNQFKIVWGKTKSFDVSLKYRMPPKPPKYIDPMIAINREKKLKK